MSAYLEITLKIAESDRQSAAAVYSKYKQPFLDSISGASSKKLLLRSDDVQVLHGFDSVDSAQSYLFSKLFTDYVVAALKPYLKSDPEIRIYEVV